MYITCFRMSIGSIGSIGHWHPLASIGTIGTWLVPVTVPIPQNPTISDEKLRVASAALGTIEVLW